MFLILPVSHDSMTARRWPWITIGIIVLNLGVHLALIGNRHEEEVDSAARRALEFHAAHPKLKAEPPLDALEQKLDANPSPDEAADDEEQTLAEAERFAKQQEELDELTRAFAAVLESSPTFRFGFVPGNVSAVGVFTHQFLHGGWAHLIFNMWFLWLVGCYMEDAWGRLLFPAFYLVAGALGAFAHFLSAPYSGVPLIGASGAVAGVMGAFLVKYLRTNIRFWYLLWLVIRPYMGAFSAPAYVMLPLWLGSQVFWGFLGSGDGVAYWAHVGGFVFGVAAAFAVRLSGHERRVDDAIETRNTVAQDPRLLAAAEQIDRGEIDAALLVLDRLAAEQPGKVEVHLERLRAAKVKQDPGLEARAYADAIRVYLVAMPDTAADLFDEASREGRAGAVPREIQLRIARQLLAGGASERGVRMFAALYADGGVDGPALRALIAHGELALSQQDGATAERLFEAAALSPHPHSELDGFLEQKLRQARAVSARSRAG